MAPGVSASSFKGALNGYGGERERSGVGVRLNLVGWLNKEIHA